MNIYEHPELYETFFKHDLVTRNWVKKNLRHYFPSGVDFFLEPACGTGFWFERVNAYYSLGIDINPIILNWARCKTKNSKVEFIMGDMRELEKHTQNKFNLILLLEVTIGHLFTKKDLLKHLRSVRKVISQDGYYFIGIPLINDFFQHEINSNKEVSTKKKLKSGGIGIMETTNTYFGKRKDIIRYSYVINFKNNKKYGSKLNFNIDLKSFDSRDVEKLIRLAKFEICKVTYMQLQGNPSSKSLYNLGLAYLVLKPIEK